MVDGEILGEGRMGDLGRKDDGGKLPLELLPFEALELADASDPIADVVPLLARWKEEEDLQALAQATRRVLVALSHLCGGFGTAVCPHALKQVGGALGYGARKYSPDNWKHVEPKSRYLGAGMRHLVAHSAGELHDEESGFMHLAHAACCLLFVLSDAAGKKS